MKKYIFFIALILMSIIAMGQTQPTKVAEQQQQKETKVVKVDDKTFKVASTNTTKASASSYQPTGYYYQMKNGEKREIYTHTITKGENKGKTFCYIKTPKGGWSKIKITPEELKG